jgi:hypothetical protein
MLYEPYGITRSILDHLPITGVWEGCLCAFSVSSEVWSFNVLNLNFFFFCFWVYSAYLVKQHLFSAFPTRNSPSLTVRSVK